MQAKIALVTILTDDTPTLAGFYQDVLGFVVKNDMGEYVEFEMEGVRFAICSRSVMENATGHPDFRAPRSGQTFELAFPLETPEDVDKTYLSVLAKGATPVKAPADMPWNQRTAFFADPDGNIHELFADLLPSA